MALNKDHLNAIAFFAQKYTAVDKMDGVDLGEKGWSLALGDTYKDRYKLTQTKKYFVWKLKFLDGKKPIIYKNTLRPDEAALEANFTKEGQNWHNENEGFFIVAPEGEQPVLS